MIKQYRKKPVIIEAIQWTGDNYEEVIEFVVVGYSFDKDKVLLQTLEGDYIIKGVNKEVYPCKSDIFKKTYEEV